MCETDGLLTVTKDCGKCDCRNSEAEHARKLDPGSLLPFCPRCDTWLAATAREVEASQAKAARDAAAEQAKNGKRR